MSAPHILTRSAHAPRCDDTETAETLAPFATTASLILILTASKIVLWRARAYASYLEEKALKLWSNGTPQLDVSNAELHRCIIQTASNKGINAIGKATKVNDNNYISSKYSSLESNAAMYYQNSSSSEVCSDTGSALKYDNKQVGGVSSSKLPVLTLEPHFIMKPVRLICKSKSGAKDGLYDKTKTHRGVREVAFYESMQFASSLQSLECLVVELSSIQNDDGYIQSGEIYSLFRLLCLIDAPNGFNLFATLLASNRNIDFRSAMLSASNRVLNILCVIASLQAGDHLTTRMIKSCFRSLYCFVKEQLDLKYLARHTSPYNGIIDIEIQTTLAKQPYLILNDITSSYKHPNIIDIKMGTQTYEPDAPHSKQLREIQKYPMQSEFGFRLVGMRIYDSVTEKYRYWDKNFGAQLNCRDECKRALGAFFQCVDEPQVVQSALHVLSCVITKLTEIKSWMECNTTLAFYASSILISYEGSSGSCHDNSMVEPVVKMIDFTHVCRKVGGDTGYIKGVDNLLGILQSIRNEL